MEHAEIKYNGGKQFIVQNRRHRVTIDLPEASGGKDEGPTPPEVFIDSLGSCVGVYVIGYCKRTGLNSDGLTIKINWEKELDAKPYYIKKIDIKIILPNTEVGTRKDALLKIARSCLIHETIKKQPEINIDLA